MSRHSQSDSARHSDATMASQLRKGDPDTYEINPDPFTLAEEKAIDPDSVGTASDYAGTTSRTRDRSEIGVRPRRFTYVDTEDEGL